MKPFHAPSFPLGLDQCPIRLDGGRSWSVNALRAGRVLLSGAAVVKDLECRLCGLADTVPTSAALWRTAANMTAAAREVVEGARDGLAGVLDSHSLPDAAERQAVLEGIGALAVAAVSLRAYEVTCRAEATRE